MQKTKSLSFLKNRLASIHQPLPLNSRDTKRLLDALTTSFRRQLDREHGWLPDDAATGATGSGKPSLLPPLPQRPTDHHVSSILSNPFFTPTSAQPAARDPADRRVAQHNAVFDEAVRKGMMTPARADGYLISVRNAILRSSMSSVEDGMRRSGAGGRVVAWLEGAGLDTTGLSPMLANPRLVHFMVCEGLEERVWAWLARLREDRRDRHQLWPRLLGALVQAKSKGALSLDGAYAAIIRGDDYFRAAKGPGFAPGMLPTWRILSYQSTVKAWKYEAPSPQLFDPYVAMLDHLGRDEPLDRAHLDLHHPVHPTADRAVDLLTSHHHPRAGADEDAWRGLLGTATSLGQGAYHLMALGLDTVQHLVRAGHAAEAQQILEIVQTQLQPLFQSCQKAAGKHSFA